MSRASDILGCPFGEIPKGIKMSDSSSVKAKRTKEEVQRAEELAQKQIERRKLTMQSKSLFS